MANELLSDVCRELLDLARAARADAANSGSDYDKGRHFAYYEVVSLLILEANSFGVDLSELGLQGIDPESDILCP
jgi:hypothetical protein